MVNVRDTAAWSLGRISQILQEMAIDPKVLEPLLQALVEGLDMEPRVATNSCWVRGGTSTVVGGGATVVGVGLLLLGVGLVLLSGVGLLLWGWGYCCGGGATVVGVGLVLLWGWG